MAKRRDAAIDVRSQKFQRGEDHQMHINEDAVSFAAFSLAKILVAELLRRGILDREELVSAISSEIAEHRKIAAATNEDAAVLLEVYRDEMPPD